MSIKESSIIKSLPQIFHSASSYTPSIDRGLMISRPTMNISWIRIITTSFMKFSNRFPVNSGLNELIWIYFEHMIDLSRVLSAGMSLPLRWKLYGIRVRVAGWMDVLQYRRLVQSSSRTPRLWQQTAPLTPSLTRPPVRRLDSLMVSYELSMRPPLGVWQLMATVPLMQPMAIVLNARVDNLLMPMIILWKC